VESIVAEFAADRSRLLDIVEAVQRRSGYVSNEAVQAIATGLGIHPVEVEDMVSFYTFFEIDPRPRHSKNSRNSYTRETARIAASLPLSGTIR